MRGISRVPILLQSRAFCFPCGQGVHGFDPDVGLFSILQGSQFDYKDGQLVHQKSCAVDWDDKDFVAWLPYVCTSGDVLDIPARKVTFKKRMASDIHIKRWVGVVPTKCRPGPRMTHEEAALAVRSVFVF